MLDSNGQQGSQDTFVIKYVNKALELFIEATLETLQIDAIYYFMI